MHKTQILLVDSLLFLLINLLIFAGNITSRMPNTLTLLQDIYTITLTEIASHIRGIETIKTSIRNQAQLYEENLKLKQELYELINHLDESNCLEENPSNFDKKIPIKLMAVNYPTEGEMLFSLPNNDISESISFNSSSRTADIFVVTTDNLLVGRVETIKNNWIFVETIYKIGFEAPVLLSKTKVAGLYKRLTEGLFIVDIPTEYNIQPNESVNLLATNILPTSILIGRVKEVRQEHAKTTYLIKIEPAWQNLRWDKYNYLLLAPNTTD